MSEPITPYAILANESDSTLYFIDLVDYNVFYKLELPYKPAGLDISNINSGTISKNTSKIAIISSPASNKFMTVDLGLRTPVLANIQSVDFPVSSIRNVTDQYPTQIRAVGVGTIDKPGIATFRFPGRDTLYTDSIQGQCIFLGSYVNYQGIYFLVTDYTSKTLTLYWLQDNGTIEMDRVVDTYTEHPVYVDFVDNYIFVLTEEGTLYGYKYNVPSDISLVTQSAANSRAHSFAQKSDPSAIYVLSDNTIEVFEFNLNNYQLIKVNTFEHGGTVNVPMGIRGIAFNYSTQKLVVSLTPYAKVFDSNGTLLKEFDNIIGDIKSVAESKRNGIIEPNEILLATSSSDILYKIDTGTFDVLSETSLKKQFYPSLNATSIAAKINGTECVVMGNKGWYAKLYTAAQQPYITTYWMSYLDTHSVKYGKYNLLASGGYWENDGIDMIGGLPQSHIYADVQGFEEYGLIYAIFYKTSRVKVYAIGYEGYMGSVWAGEIQDKKAPAEIMVDESPINVTSISEGNFLLVACYNSNNIDIVDISNIQNICIPPSPAYTCPPEHKYFGVAHSVTTNEKPQTIIYNEVKNRVFVLTKDYVEVYSFDCVAKTLNKISEFTHQLNINPIYGVNQMAIGKDGSRAYILGSGIISVFDTDNGQFIRNLNRNDFTSIFIY